MCFCFVIMHPILLSIGSNTYAERNIAKARRMLELHFPGIQFTPALHSKPYGEKYKRRFLNILAKTTSADTAQHICLTLKDMEKQMGRKLDDKEKGRVVIDMDLVMYDHEILRPTDYERSYVRELLNKF